MFNANPYAYNPYAVQYQPQQQQQMPIVSQPQMARPMPETGIIWVNGLPEAENYLVAPNSAVQLWDRNGKAVYVKSADQTGLNKLKIYDLIERRMPEEAVSRETNEFVHIEDFNSLRCEFDELRGIVNGFTSKKTTKKETKDDE